MSIILKKWKAIYKELFTRLQELKVPFTRSRNLIILNRQHSILRDTKLK